MPEARSTRDHTIDRQIALAREWDALVEEVRQIGPEFMDFLRPPPIATLLPEAGQGTVIAVNVTRTGCAALIVSSDGVRELPLPDLTLSLATEAAYRQLGCLTELESATSAVRRGYLRADSRPGAASFHELHQAKIRLLVAQTALDAELLETMGWLWHAVAAPVLTDIGVTEPGEPAVAPRLWWCPTGPLTFLPLHAAGFHDGSGRSVLDRAVSSYTPTLRALAQATATPSADPGTDRMLVVAVPEPAGEVALPQVVSEVEVLTALFPADRLTVLQGAAATRAAVLAALPGHRWVHFSCHARQRLNDPSGGGFLLHDGLLTVRELGLGRYRGEFGLLSACMTATGGVRLADELLTLAASLHYTGFRHVLAMLWSVDAEVALELTGAVYHESIVDGVLRPERAAVAAHRAVLGLRASNADRPRRWALFTHTGP